MKTDMSPTSSTNVVNNVPYDILREIFHLCLPKNPLLKVQPNPKIAPILLCHICSSWRVVALSTRSLWTHLYTLLPMKWDSDLNPTTWSAEGLARAIDFMKWWKANHGTMAPFLRFDIYHRSHEKKGDSSLVYLPVGQEPGAFLSAYMSSAQFLEVGVFYTYLTRGSGLPAAMSSKAHTMVSDVNSLYHSSNFSDAYGYFHYDTILPSQVPPTLRRLAVCGADMLMDYVVNLKNWSTLTHLALDHITLYEFSPWFSAIRALGNLQWGDFYITFLGHHADESEPPKFTLSLLTTLTVVCVIDCPVHFPLTMLFKNLELPALHTLSLASSTRSWRDSRATIEIHNVLKSAPAITTLSLRDCFGFGFLCFEDGDITPNEIGDTPHLLSTDAPHLSHLRVELPCFNYLYLYLVSCGFVDEFLVHNRWLDIGSTTNLIRKITIITKQGPAPKGPVSMESQLKENFKELLMEAINDCVTEKTVFHSILYQQITRGPDSTSLSGSLGERALESPVRMMEAWNIEISGIPNFYELYALFDNTWAHSNRRA